MRIARLKIANFRSVGSVELEDLPRINYLAGPNRAGKSTILDAVTVGLSGHCRMSSAGGKDGALMRREGAGRKWVVEMEFVSPGQTENFVIKRKEGDGERSDAATYISNLVGVPPHTALASLSSPYLVSMGEMEPRDAQKILLDIATPKGRIEVDDALGELLKLIGAKPKTLHLGEIEELYKAAYQARREAGRDVRKQKIELTPLGPGLEAFEDSSISDLMSAADKIVGKLGELRSQREDLLVAENEAHHIALRRKEYEDKLKEFEEFPVERPAEPEPAEMDGANAEIDTASKQIEEAKDKRRACVARVSDLRRRVAEVEKLDVGPCPMCCHELQKPQLGHLVRQLSKQLERAEAGRVAAEGLVEKLEKQRQEWVDQLDEMHELNKAAGRWDAAQEEAGKLKEALERLGSAETVDHSEATQGLAERIGTGEGRLSAIQHRISQMETMAKVRAAGGDDLERYERLDELVKLLEPGGDVRAALGSEDETGKFVDYVQSTLLGFGLPQADLRPMIEGEGPLTVRGRPTTLLSDSERLLVGIGLQLASAKWTNLGIVVIDDWERLDDHHKRVAQKSLLAADVQCFIATVMAGTQEAYIAKATEANKRTNYRCYLVQMGKAGSTEVAVPGKVTKVKKRTPRASAKSKRAG